MEIYAMDENFQRENLVDTYKSFIWTERFKAIGDFELVAKADRSIKSTLPVGRFITIDKTLSNRTMIVESHEDEVDDDGTRLVKITGRSAECLFESRPAMPSLGSLTAAGKWEITDKPHNIMSKLWATAGELSPINPNDRFPHLGEHLTQVVRYSNIPFPEETVTMTFEPGDLYTGMKRVADLYNINFGITFNSPGTRMEGLLLLITMGVDRSRGNVSKYDPVVFSPSLDNITNTKTLQSIQDYKNVAYIYAQNGSAIVYADGVSEDVSGVDRRVLVVNASDIDLPAGTALDNALIIRGREELSQHQRAYAFDGEITKNSQYAYYSGSGAARKPKVYELGTLVSQISEEGFVSRMRVTEQIFVSDEQGDREYPTLEVDFVATPGSWAARPATQVWAGVPDTEFWGTLT